MQKPKPKWKSTSNYQPKTSLGKRLLAIRNKAITKGLPLLDADEINQLKED